jgi:hypothetical protein
MVREFPKSLNPQVLGLGLLFSMAKRKFLGKDIIAGTSLLSKIYFVWSLKKSNRVHPEGFTLKEKVFLQCQALA